MTISLDDLERRLSERAETSSPEVLAARARLEGRLVRAARPARPGRRLLAAAVAAVVVGVLAAAVVAVVHGRPSTIGPAAGPSMSLTDWQFTVRSGSLPSGLSVVQYVHADRSTQVAAVLTPADEATSNHYSAVVEVAVDSAGLGVTRPANATTLDRDTWTAPLEGDSYGVGGVELVWTDSSGYTARVVAGTSAVAQHIQAATTIGADHPVRFPMTVAADWFPVGSRVRSFDFVGVQGATVVVDVPDAPAVGISVAGSGVFVDNAQPGATTRPFGSGFAAIGPAWQPVRELTSPVIDLAVSFADERSATNTLPVDRLRALVTGARFVGMADQQAWFPLADALPTG